MKKPPKPEIRTTGIYIPGPFMHAKVGDNGRFLLALASQFRAYGGNVYALCSNESLAAILCCSYQALMRAKRRLRTAGLLDEDGNPGDYAHLGESWEKRTGLKWEGYL